MGLLNCVLAGRISSEVQPQWHQEYCEPNITSGMHSPHFLFYFENTQFMQFLRKLFLMQVPEFNLVSANCNPLFSRLWKGGAALDILHCRLAFRVQCQDPADSQSAVCPYLINGQAVTELQEESMDYKSSCQHPHSHMENYKPFPAVADSTCLFISH